MAVPVGALEQKLPSEAPQGKRQVVDNESRQHEPPIGPAELARHLLRAQAVLDAEENDQPQDEKCQTKGCDSAPRTEPATQGKLRLVRLLDQDISFGRSVIDLETHDSADRARDRVAGTGLTRAAR